MRDGVRLYTRDLTRITGEDSRKKKWKKLTEKSLTVEPGDSWQLNRDVINQDLLFTYWQVQIELKNKTKGTSALFIRLGLETSWLS